MKGLTSIERIVMDVLDKKKLIFDQISLESGIKDNIVYNILQSLVMREFIRTDGFHYWVKENLSQEQLQELHQKEYRRFEALEMIEAHIFQEKEREFKFQRIALSERDEKIFKAMLYNLESFLKDAHASSKEITPISQRKIIFWGLGEHQPILDNLIGA